MIFPLKMLTWLLKYVLNLVWCLGMHSSQLWFQIVQDTDLQGRKLKNVTEELKKHRCNSLAMKNTSTLKEITQE